MTKKNDNTIKIRKKTLIQIYIREISMEGPKKERKREIEEGGSNVLAIENLEDSEKLHHAKVF